MNQTVFRSGCAYWPCRKGPLFVAGGLSGGATALFDRGEVEDDLSHIAEVGFNFVRIALPWEAAQPDPLRIRTRLLDQLVQVLESAQASGLTVQLVLMGRLGGTLFAPDWLFAREPTSGGQPATIRTISNGWETPWPLGNVYQDSGLLKAQRYVWQEIAANLAAHPALTELDLGAGGLLTTLPPTVPDAPFVWWESLSDAATASTPALALLYSDQIALLMQPNLPKLHEWQQTVGRLGFAVHAVPHPQEKGRADEEWIHFMLLLARTVAHTPVECSALVLPTSNRGATEARRAEMATPQPALFREDEQARFFTDLLPTLYRAGVPSVCHAVWADTPQKLAPTPPFDRNLPLRHSGLLRADGSEKEAIRAWQRFNTHTKIEKAEKAGRDLELDEEEWYQRRSELDYVSTLYQRFRNGEL